MANRDYIFHNFWWKVTSLLLAVIVWFVVYPDSASGANDLRKRLEFPRHTLAVMRDSSDKRPIRVTPTEVNVVVKVPMFESTGLNDSDIQTFIDLNEVDEHHKKARIHVYLPRGVLLESITPDEASVEIIE